MKIAPFILILLLLFSGCSADQPLTILIHPALDADLLPTPTEGLQILEAEVDQPADLTFIVEELIQRADAPLPKLTIEREYLIPLGEPFQLRADISLDELREREMREDALELVPLSQWTLPGRGMRIDELSPADAAYPLVRHRYLVPRFGLELNEDQRAELDQWLSRLEENLAQNRSDRPPELYWIAGVGDMMLQRGIEDRLLTGRSGLEAVFSDLQAALRSYDLLAGNLEGAVTRGGTRFPKSYNFRFKPEVLPRLKEVGFDYLTLANNHCYDYGREGFIDTLTHLKQAGIPTSGAGLTPEEAAAPAIIKLGNTEIRLLGLGAFPPERNGFNGAREAQVRDDRPGILWYGDSSLEAIRAYADRPGIDIVMVHGGHEWRRSTAADQRRIYRSLVDAGVEIVFGAHPHVLQGMEHYQSGLIYYSLGNFLFNGMQEMAYAEETLIAELGIIEGKILYRSETPVQLNGPVIARARGSRIIEEFLNLSKDIPRD